MAEAISNGVFEITEVSGIPEINSKSFPVSHGTADEILCIHCAY